MDNTDALIRNITGSTNYVKELEKICGNIEGIDKAWFLDVSSKNAADDGVIRKIIIDLLGKSDDVSKDFFRLSIEINFAKPLRVVVKKSKKSSKARTKEFPRDELRPKVFIKSPYFRLLKEMEKTCDRLMTAFGHEGENIDSIKKTQPELFDIKTFYGHRIDSVDDIALVKKIHDAAHGIISRYMLPMYDMRSVMEKNWGMLSSLFKHGDLSIEDFTVSQQEVKEMLYLFMVAKYRCAITENNKHYVKLFMNIINSNHDEETDSTVFGKMDPARFLELLDTINLEAIDKKQKVYKFAEQSKSIIKRLVAKKPDESMDDILHDISTIVSTGDVLPEEPPKVTVVEEDHDHAYDDVLGHLVE